MISPPGTPGNPGPARGTDRRNWPFPWTDNPDALDILKSLRDQLSTVHLMDADCVLYHVIVLSVRDDFDHSVPWPLEAWEGIAKGWDAVPTNCRGTYPGPNIGPPARAEWAILAKGTPPTPARLEKTLDLLSGAATACARMLIVSGLYEPRRGLDAGAWLDFLYHLAWDNPLHLPYTVAHEYRLDDEVPPQGHPDWPRYPSPFRGETTFRDWRAGKVDLTSYSHPSLYTFGLTKDIRLCSVLALDLLIARATRTREEPRRSVAPPEPTSAGLSDPGSGVVTGIQTDPPAEDAKAGPDPSPALSRPAQSDLPPEVRVVAAAYELAKEGRPVTLKGACDRARADRRNIRQRHKDVQELILKLGSPDRSPFRGVKDRRSGCIDAVDDSE